VLQIAGVHDLLELTTKRHRQHGLAQVDRLPHESKARSCDHRSGALEIAYEAVFAKGAVAQTALHFFLFDVAAHPVNTTFDAGPGQDVLELAITLGSLVHEQMLALGRRRRQDFGSQDRRMQAGVLLANLWPEEGSNQVVAAEGQLALD